MASQERCQSVDDEPPSALDSLRVLEGLKNLPREMFQRLGGVCPSALLHEGNAGEAGELQDAQATSSQHQDPGDSSIDDSGARASEVAPHETTLGDENDVEIEHVVIRPRRKNSVQLRRNRFSSNRSSNMTIDEENPSDEENPDAENADCGGTGRCRQVRSEYGPRSADWVESHPKRTTLWRSNSSPLVGSAPDVIPQPQSSSLLSRSPDLVLESQENFPDRDTKKRLDFEGPVHYNDRKKHPTVKRSVSFCDTGTENSDDATESSSSRRLSDDGKKRRQQYKSSGYGTGESDKNSQMSSQFSSAMSDSVIDDDDDDSFAKGKELADNLSDNTSSGGTVENLPKFGDLISLTFSSGETVAALGSHGGSKISQDLTQPVAVTCVDPKSEEQAVAKDPQCLLSQTTGEIRMDAGLPHLSIFEDHSVEMPPECELLSEERTSVDMRTLKSSSESSEENDTARAQATAVLNEHMEKTLSGERMMPDPQPRKPSSRQRESEGRQHICTIVMELLKSESWEPDQCCEVLQAIYNNSPSPHEIDNCPYDYCLSQASEDKQQQHQRMWAREVDRRLALEALPPGNQTGRSNRPSQTLQPVPARQGRQPPASPRSQAVSGSANNDDLVYQRAQRSARPTPSEEVDLEEEKLQRCLELCHSLERAARCDLLICSEPRCSEARKQLQDFKDLVLREPRRSQLVVEVLWALRLHSERCEALKCPVFACTFLRNINPWDLGAAVRQISSELQTPFLRLTDSCGQDCSYLQIDHSKEYARPMREEEDWIVLFNLKESKDVIMAEIVSSSAKCSHNVVIKKAALHEGTGQWGVLQRLRRLQQNGGGVAVVHHYWAMQTHSSLLVCSHFHPEGTLRELLDKRNGKLDLMTVLRLILEVVRGVIAVNEVGIIYLNWTSSNILLDSGGLRVKVSNFTSSVPHDPRGQSGDLVSIGDIKLSLPPPIIPPELLRSPDEPLTLKADSWGCGCLLYELLEGKMVWHHLRHEDPEDIWRKMHDCAYRISPPPSKDLKSLFEGCWKVKHQERHSLRSIQADLWSLTMPDHQPVLICV